MNLYPRSACASDRRSIGKVKRNAFLHAFALSLSIPGISTHVQAAEEWPHYAYPKTVDRFDVGAQLSMNGLPMHIQGFTSSLRPVDLRRQFRKALGEPIVENRLGNRAVLGRADGRYYTTVQIEEVAWGSKGIIAITDLKGMSESRTSHTDENSRWLDRLPAGSTIASRMISRDGAKDAEHLVIVNNHSAALNGNALKHVFLSDGYVLQRDIDSLPREYGAVPHSVADGLVLLFKGQDKEATAAVGRDSQGRTAVVLNIVKLRRAFK